LPRDEVGLLLRRLDRHPELRGAFGRYVLAGEVLRAPGGQCASAGFAARVQAGIDREAVTWKAGRTAAGRPGGNRTVAAVAIAASAALFTVLLVVSGAQRAGQIAQDTLDRARDSFATRPLAQAASPTPAHSQRLAGYLVAHSQFATSIGRRTAWSSVLASDPGITRVALESLEAP
jgi:negative regulator of sigma E activity